MKFKEGKIDQDMTEAIKNKLFYKRFIQKLIIFNI